MSLQKIVDELRAISDDLHEQNSRKMAIDEDANEAVSSILGDLVGVIYHRDGQNYIHRFRKASQPILAVTNDGLKLHIVGGQYVVTENGIEDA